MKKTLLVIILSLLFILPSALFAADTGSIAGKVSAEETGIPLANANVQFIGTDIGILTKGDGSFILTNIPVGNYTVTASFLGYEKQSERVEVKANLTTTVMFSLIMKPIGIQGITVISDRAKINTPVAFTDIAKEEITSSLASRDIPLVLINTPSVYSTGQGGGAGDARINIRGFNQRNVAVMINGVPINDMENGWVYWSNWDGLGDATSSIQVQRGLSAVNLAVPSIGGTMNMITDPTQMSKCVNFKQEYGSGGFIKKTLAANSGLVNDKYAFSINITRKTGNGIIDKTWTDAWSYYLATSYNINDNNKLEFYAAGAPQRHGQSRWAQNMAAYNHKYAKDHSGVPDSVVADYLEAFPEAGMKYNENWNVINSDYKTRQWWDGEEHDRYSPYFLNESVNFYHKPQLNLNWFTKLNEKMDVYSVLFYSGGKGGGSGYYGSLKWDYSGPSRIADWNATIARNDTSSIGSIGILRNSVNTQWAIGALSKLQYKVDDRIKTSFGLDWRTAEIEHFREVRNLLGGNYYDPSIDEDNNLSDFWTTEEDFERKLGDKIDYCNTNNVDWIGGYAQGEYSEGKLTATGMGGLSSVKYSYTDHFHTADTLANGDPDIDSGEFTSESGWVTGFQFKCGSSYRLNDNIGFFGNAGYVNKCPIFDEVINDWTGDPIEDPKNEKFTSIEAGGNLVCLDGLLNIKGNVYLTLWNDESKSVTVEDPTGEDVKVFISGIDSRHKGIEFEVHSHPISLVKFDLSFSKGWWLYLNDLTATYEIEDSVYTMNCYVKNLKVGDAPQTQVALGATLYPIKGLRANISYKYFCDFYAGWDPFSRQDPSDTEQSWKIPDYSIVDLHVFYKLPTVVKGLDIEAFTHIFNLFDEVYVQDATDNSAYNAWAQWGSGPYYSHSGSAAEVFFGLPRRFNAGLSIKL